VPPTVITRAQVEHQRRAFRRTVFPQMANWLPDHEADQLRFDFATDLARLDAA
jgi:hypothetical protein